MRARRHPMSSVRPASVDQPGSGRPSFAVVSARPSSPIGCCQSANCPSRPRTSSSTAAAEGPRFGAGLGEDVFVQVLEGLTPRSGRSVEAARAACSSASRAAGIGGPGRLGQPERLFRHVHHCGPRGETAHPSAFPCGSDSPGHRGDPGDRRDVPGGDRGRQRLDHGRLQLLRALTHCRAGAPRYGVRVRPAHPGRTLTAALSAARACPSVRLPQGRRASRKRAATVCEPS